VNSNNVYLVIGLVITIVVLANAVTFLAARGARSTRLNWFNKTKAGLNQPFKTEDQAFDELGRLVRQLPESEGRQAGDDRAEKPTHTPL
jgi:hypothetical protein